VDLSERYMLPQTIYGPVGTSRVTLHNLWTCRNVTCYLKQSVDLSERYVLPQVEKYNLEVQLYGPLPQ